MKLAVLRTRLLAAFDWAAARRDMCSRQRDDEPMFRSPLQLLHKPLEGSVASASFKKYATRWTMLAALSFAALIIGLDSTILNGALASFPGQLDAEGSTLQWIARAKAIAVWAGTTSEGMGLGPLAGGLLLVVTSLTTARQVVPRHALTRDLNMQNKAAHAAIPYVEPPTA
jgi:hypothetical protein